MIVTPGANTGSPSLSWRKLDLRATDEPLIAPAKWPSSVDDDARVEEHRISAGLRAASDSAARPRAPGQPADRRRRGRGLRGVARCATHGRAASPRPRRRSPRPSSRGRSPDRRRQNPPTSPARASRPMRSRRAAARIGDAGTAERRLLGVERARAQRGGVGILAVDRRRGTAARRAGADRRRKAGIRVLRRFGGHRHRALDQRARASSARSDEATVADRGRRTA